ncbi:hypothetical protein ACFL96_19620 [Thermoproteota archaeon]
MVKCNYCGEEEATTVIMNPNTDDGGQPTWEVFLDCKDVIRAQMKLSMGCVIQGMGGIHEKHGEKMVSEVNAVLEEIANRTKKPIFSGTLYKNKDDKIDSVSVEFTGDLGEK